MDNLTHSLVGLVAGAAAARTAPMGVGGLSVGTRRGILMGMGVAGGNLPDIDLLWSVSAGAGDKLGYLLEHRGYTHTLLGCAMLAALVFCGALLWLQFRSLEANRSDRLTLGIMALVSVFLHLGMDALNVYGVHPFWPWNNHWFYGDALFIIEPLFWLATAPLLPMLRSTVARLLHGLMLLIAGVAVLVMHQFQLAWWSVPILAVLLIVACRRRPLRTAALLSATLMLAIVAGFTAGNRVATGRLHEMAAAEFPGFTTLDQVLSPQPTNPFCWDVLLVQSGDGRYIVRRGLLSIAAPPSVAHCSQLLAGRGTAPMLPVPATDSRAMLWQGEFSAPRASLAELVAQDCSARELMQFVRAPFAVEQEDHWVIGDLRFDREVGLGMSELAVDPRRPRACRHNLPWVAPRADLLEAAVTNQQDRDALNPP